MKKVVNVPYGLHNDWVNNHETDANIGVAKRRLMEITLCQPPVF